MCICKYIYINHKLHDLYSIGIEVEPGLKQYRVFNNDLAINYIKNHHFNNNNNLFCSKTEYTLQKMHEFPF